MSNDRAACCCRFDSLRLLGLKLESVAIVEDSGGIHYTHGCGKQSTHGVSLPVCSVML